MMLKTHLQQQFTYNDWAWQHVFTSVRQLSAENYHADRGFFWGSIHGMLVHCLSAESIWLERSKGNSPTALFDPSNYADFDSVLAHWSMVTTAWYLFLDTIEDEQLGRLIEYKSTEGVRRQNSQREIVQHVLLHGMEHRSQLTPTLYQLDVATPPLDFIYFALE